jgi:hypothetical protein
LKAGNLTLASLQFNSSFSSLALAETADGKWSFKQIGFCNQRITIWAQGQPSNIAIYQAQFWGDNELRFNDGKTYMWKSINFWSTQWAFTKSNGELVMVVKRGGSERKFSDIFKTQLTVEIYPSKEHAGNPGWLLPLALYLFILQQQAASIAAAGIIAGA